MEKFEKIQDFIDSYGLPSADKLAYLIENKDYDGIYDFLEKNRETLRKLPGYKDVEISRPDKKKTIERLVEEYPDGKIPASYQEDIAADLNMSTDDLKVNLQKAKEEKKIDEAVDEEAEGRKRREKEIADMPWYKKMLMNEYSQKRYIEDPNSSIFGKEGKFNPYSSEGQKELRDVILGGTGAVADFIPAGRGINFLRKAPKLYKALKPATLGILAGPGVRAGRDIAEGEKSAGEIVASAGVDAATNAILGGQLKGFGVPDMGPVHNIVEKTPVGKWSAEVKEARNLRNRPLPRVPEFKTYKEAYAWANQQPANVKEAYLQELKASKNNVKNAKLDEVRSTLEEQRKEVNRHIRRPEWIQDNPIKAKVGEYSDAAVIGLDRTLGQAGGSSLKKTFSPDSEKEKFDPKAEKEKRKEESKTSRWLKGFATWDEQQSPEYKAWKEENLKKIMGE